MPSAGNAWFVRLPAGYLSMYPKEGGKINGWWRISNKHHGHREAQDRSNCEDYDACY